MAKRGKVIGISALVFGLSVVATLFILNKSSPTDDTKLGKVKQPELSALDEYLANPPVVENAPWTKSTPPHESIPNSLKQFTSGETELERAYAIGFLAYTAEQMARVPETKEAAKEVLEKWVMPNLNLTKLLPKTSAYDWENTILAARHAHKSLGNQEANRACLALLRDEGTKQDDREKAIYLLAYDFALSHQYQEGIETFNTLPEDSRWADQRPRINEIWRKKQVEEEKAKQQPQDEQKAKP